MFIELNDYKLKSPPNSVVYISMKYFTGYAVQIRRNIRRMLKRDKKMLDILNELLIL